MTAPGDTNLRIEALEAENQRLRHRVDELEALILGGFEPPVEWQLPRREAQIFAMLVARGRATKEQLFAAIYASDAEETSETVVESHVSKLRKKIRPFGVIITSRRYEGYRLENPERFRRSA